MVHPFSPYSSHADVTNTEIDIFIAQILITVKKLSETHVSDQKGDQARGYRKFCAKHPNSSP